ncbi:uncharacterized protein FYW49_019131 [Xenentodon cancila]
MEVKELDPLSVEESSGRREEESWNRDGQVPVKELRAHSDAITAVRLCRDNACILTCSSDCTAALWDVRSSQRLRTFDGVHSNTVSECSLIPNTNRMVTVSWDKKMVSWDLETGQVLWKRRMDGLLTSCSCSSNGRLLVCTADPQNAVYVCDTVGGQTLHCISDHHRSTITRCRFDPPSQRVATVSADRAIKLWDLRAQRTTISVHSNHGNVVSDCCFTSNGHFLCTASWDRTLKLWDLQAGGFRSRGGTTVQKGHEGSVSCCNFSEDASLLVSGSYDRTVFVWDSSSLSQTFVLKGHTDWVTDVSIGADQKMVVSSSKDGTVRFWDIEDLDQVRKVQQRKRTDEDPHPEDEDVPETDVPDAVLLDQMGK